ncbi:MAG: T9SS type A sorting domain-containing protein [Taibaiella sp.]|nr:T9SS type A sorting domain-containing protein [Taibaiella sp.]
MIRLLSIFIFTCVCLISQAQVNIITTIAGTGIAGYSGDGGPAVDAHLNSPYAVCLDLDNNLLFCDGFNHSIRKINFSTGIITTIAGTGIGGFSGDGSSASGAQLFLPQGVCTDINGNIFISDGGNNRIRKVSSTGNISTIAGTGGAGAGCTNCPAINAELYAPAGLNVKGSYLYVSDCLNHKIRQVILTTGIILTIAGTGTVGYSGDMGLGVNAQFNSVLDVECDNVGYLYVSDSWNGVIRKINVASNIVTTIVGTGTIGYSGDNGPAVNAQLNEPTEIYLDKNNNLFIADYRNGAIRKVDGITGIITTVAGGIAGYGGDGGPATDAKLKCTDVCVDEHGNIYIADYVNDRIRKVNNAVDVNGIDKGIESKLYPNPTKGIFSIHTPINISLVSIYNIAGVRIDERTCTTTDTEIDISNQPPGVYMVYVQCGEKQYVSKVVKN